MNIYRIRNTSGQYWAGTCWGVVPNTFDKEDLDVLELDDEIKPENFFNNASDDIGWGDESGNIFARAERA